MRLLFYAINGVGLGHVRRLLLIAEEIRKKQPEVHILFITNSAFPQMIEENGFPCIRLPSEISPTVQSHFSASTLSAELHDQLFLAITEHFSPDAIVFDSAWSWQQLEFARRNSIKTVFILRKDTNEHMARTMKEWERFDLICIPHSEREFTGLGASKKIISHLRKLNAVFAGPVVPTFQRGKKKPESQFRILVTAGGGGWSTTQKFLDSVSDGLRAVLKANDNISAEIITGPLFRGTLQETAGSTVHRYLENSELLGHMRKSHLAIAEASYNTCNDLIATALPALLVPAKREIESQEERAQYFQKAGCARVVQNAPKAIQKAVEQLYRDRLTLDKMRKACSSALGKPGTPLIAEKIISLVPKVTRVTLSKTLRIKDGDFVVVKGKPSEKALKQLTKLRKRAGFIILEAALGWFRSQKYVEELRAAVDAVAIPLTQEQSLKIPKELRAAIKLLRESGPYFEIRISITLELTTKMAAIAKQFHRLGCPQLQFQISPKIKDNMLEKPLSDVRNFMLSSKGNTLRIYCSRTPVVPSEFPKGRLFNYQQEQTAREMKREQEALEMKLLKERRAQETLERKLLRKRRRALNQKRTRLIESNKRLLGARKEAEHMFNKLEKSKTVRLWYGDQQSGGVLPDVIMRMDSQLKELESRREQLTAISQTDPIPDDLPEGIGKELAVEWCTVLDDLKAVVRRMDEKRASHLSQVELELDTVLLRQDDFKQGKVSGTTWRQLDLKRQRLISAHRRLWIEHIGELTEERRLINAKKRKLAELIRQQIESLASLVQEDIKKLSLEMQDALKRHQQEVRARSKSKEVKQYLALKRQLEHLNKRIVSFDTKISEVNQQLNDLG